MKPIICCGRTSVTSLKLRYARFNSTSTGKGSFPLDLPRDFKFVQHSITYSNGHEAVPDYNPKSIPVQNPATQEILQSIDCASPDTIESSITDAYRIFKSGVWSRADPTERLHVLSRTADLLRQYARELASRIPPRRRMCNNGQLRPYKQVVQFVKWRHNFLEYRNGSSITLRLHERIKMTSYRSRHLPFPPQVLIQGKCVKLH